MDESCPVLRNLSRLDVDLRIEESNALERSKTDDEREQIRGATHWLRQMTAACKVVHRVRLGIDRSTSVPPHIMLGGAAAALGRACCWVNQWNLHPAFPLFPSKPAPVELAGILGRCWTELAKDLAWKHLEILNNDHRHHVLSLPQMHQGTIGPDLHFGIFWYRDDGKGQIVDDAMPADFDRVNAAFEAIPDLAGYANVDFELALEIFGDWPEQSSGSEYPGGAIKRGGAFEVSVGSAIRELCKMHPIRIAWRTLKHRSRKASVVWDQDGEPSRKEGKGREVWTAANRFRALLRRELERKVPATAPDSIPTSAADSTTELEGVELWSPSRRVGLRKFGEPPMVDGKNVPLLKRQTQYDVVAALLRAGAKGLSVTGLNNVCGDGVGVFKRLAKKPEWKPVCRIPGVGGSGYAIL